MVNRFEEWRGAPRQYMNTIAVVIWISILLHFFISLHRDINYNFTSVLISKHPFSPLLREKESKIFVVILFWRSKQLSSVYGLLCSPEGKIMENLRDLSCSGAAMNRLKRGRRYTDTTVVRILDLHFLISLHLSWRKKIEIFGDGNFRFPFFYIFF